MENYEESFWRELQNLLDEVEETDPLQQLDPQHQTQEWSIWLKGGELLPIELLRLKQIKTLDLHTSYTHYHPVKRDLPDFIGQMTWLRSLKLYGFDWEQLPLSLGGIEKLEELTIYRVDTYYSTQRKPIQTSSACTALFQQLKRLRHLKSLVLKEIIIGVLPEAITELSALESLSLSNNRLSKLPDQMGRLEQLKWLDISANSITAFPASIADLPKLETLIISAVALRDYPLALLRIKDQLGYNGLRIEGDAWGKTDHPARSFKAAWKGIHSHQFDLSQATFLFNVLREQRTDWTESSAEELVMLLQSEVKHLQQAALAEWERRTSVQHPALSLPPEGTQIAALGELTSTKSYWSDKLLPYNIKLAFRANAQHQHILLGVRCGWIAEQLAGKTIWTEKRLRQALDQVEQPFLLQADEAAAQYLDQLRQLLHSNQSDSIELAWTMIKAGGLPAAFMTDLFIHFKINPALARQEGKAPQKSMRTHILSILQQYVSPEAVTLFSKRYEVAGNSTSEETHYRNLLRYKEAIPALDIYAICMYLLNKEGRADRNGARYGVNCLRGEELRRFIEATKVWEPKQRVLDLRRMHLSHFSAELLTLPVRVLILSNNTHYYYNSELYSMPPELVQMQTIEELDMREVYTPYHAKEVIEQLPKLKIIRISARSNPHYVRLINDMIHLKDKIEWVVS